MNFYYILLKLCFRFCLYVSMIYVNQMTGTWTMFPNFNGTVGNPNLNTSATTHRTIQYVTNETDGLINSLTLN